MWLFSIIINYYLCVNVIIITYHTSDCFLSMLSNCVKTKKSKRIGRIVLTIMFSSTTFSLMDIKSKIGDLDFKGNWCLALIGNMDLKLFFLVILTLWSANVVNTITYEGFLTLRLTIRQEISNFYLRKCFQEE